MANSIHIALIDDDAAVLDSLRLYFARHELKASCFNAAEEFLAAVDRSAQFDCVVSDVRMPGMSGLDLVGHLNARGFARAIILITGHGDVDMAVAAIKIGAFDFIEKPFDENRLLASIRNALEQAGAKEQRRRTRTTTVQVQFAVSAPASSHGTCRRWTVKQGNRNAAQNQLKDRREPSCLGHGADRCAQSGRTRTYGDANQAADIGLFSDP